MNNLIELTPLGIIKIAGNDAEKFLQGQLTCDVREVTGQQSRLGGHCDHKGRLQATFRLFKYQADYYLQVPKNLIEHLLQCLKKYAVFSKVTLTDVSADWQQLGITGEDSVNSLNESIAQQLPVKTSEVICVNQLVIVRLAEQTPRFCLLGSNITIEPIKQLLLSRCQPAAFSQWELADINAGIPTISPETIGLFTPQQINYTLINGVSFNKGCYTGQEIIARMHYLGKLKQHMYKITFNSAATIPPGAALFINKTDACGTLVQAVKIQDGSWQGLAVINDNALNQPLYLENAEQPILGIQELSYTTHS